MDPLTEVTPARSVGSYLIGPGYVPQSWAGSEVDPAREIGSYLFTIGYIPQPLGGPLGIEVVPARETGSYLIGRWVGSEGWGVGGFAATPVEWTVHIYEG